MDWRPGASRAGQPCTGGCDDSRDPGQLHACCRALWAAVPITCTVVRSVRVAPRRGRLLQLQPEVNILQSVCLRSVSVPSFGIRISGGREKRREGQEAGAGRKVASGRDAVRTQRCRRAAPTLAGVCGKSVRSLRSAEPSPERVTGRLCPLVLSGEPGDKTRSCRSLRCSP